MARNSTGFPFLRAEQGIEPASWLIRIEPEQQQAAPLPDAIPGWDYQSDIELSRIIELDVDKLRSGIGLSENDGAIDALVSLSTGETRKVSRIVWRETLPGQGKAALSPTIVIEGGEMSSGFTLVTELIMSSPPTTLGNLVAKKPGSRLWSDEIAVDLEGTLSRFPMEVCDFSETFSEPGLANAPWYLSWYSENPEASFLGAVRVVINSRRENILKRIESCDPDTVSMLMSDVAIQMCSGMLQNDIFVEGYGDFAEDSLGGVVSSWLELALPGRGIEGCKSMLKNDPSRFNASLQAAMVVEDE